MNKIDFAAVNRAALTRLPYLLMGWLPDGRREGPEWVAKNPKRDDRRPGSFKVNTASGKWGDWACGVFGGDPIALYAYLRNLSQGEAARELARELGVNYDR